VSARCVVLFIDWLLFQAAESSLVLLGALKFLKVKNKQVQTRSSRKRPMKQVAEVAGTYSKLCIVTLVI